MEYPLLKNCYPDWEAEATRLYNELKQLNYKNRMIVYQGYIKLLGVFDKRVRPQFTTLSGRKTKLVITHEEEDYWKYNVISDFFTECVRVKCHKKGCISPYEYWEANKESLPKDVLQAREAIYEQHGQGRSECTLHRPIVTVVIYRYFSGKRILDPCMGWGGRLIAALSIDCELYVGIDPNEDLHPHYQEIQRVFGGNSQLFCCPFETFEWDEEPFDIAYTSPPYFDLEDYGDSPGQSIVQYPKLTDWINKFLLPLLENCIKYVKLGGIIAINISDTKNTRYITSMLDYMQTRGQKYMGTIAFARKDPTQGMPIFVWRRS